MTHLAWALFDTPLGRCAAAWSEVGLVRLLLPEASLRATRERLAALEPDARPAEPPPWARRALDRLARALGGESIDLADLPLDLSRAGPFERRVYDELRRVPPGTTVTYGELAERADHPGAARAVGRAVGANPLPVAIPCHRVLAARGPGGFSAPGGLRTKARLLALEGVALAPDQPTLFD